MKSSKESGGQLLQELEALSQALYKAQIVHTTNPAPKRELDQASLRRRASEAVGRPEKQPVNPSALESRHSISDIGRKNAAAVDKEADDSEEIDGAQKLGINQRKGFWNWKPLRALSHIGQQRFPCEFSAHVHGIDKLPPSMNGLRLQVKLRHRDTGVQTMPSRVAHNCAEFQEILHFRCTVYGSKSKSSGTIKFMAKSFTLSVVAMDVEELDLGKHQLDLSRILPSSSSAASPATAATAAWNTSFKLSGKAKGSSLAVTFGYEILDGSSGAGGGGGGKLFGSSGRLIATSRSFNSLPSSPHASSHKKTNSVGVFGSPTASEPGSESVDFAAMDQFKLDDPEDVPLPPPAKPPGLPPAPPPTFKAAPPLSSGNKSAARSDQASDRRGRSLFPEIDARIAPGTPERSQGRQEEVQPEVDEQNELLDDFGVVEKGVETSLLEMDHEQKQEQATPLPSPPPQQQQQQQEQNLDYKFEEEEEDEEGGGAANDVAQEPNEKEAEQERSSEWQPAVEQADWKKEKLDWKDELEQDYLYDTVRNPGVFDWQSIEPAREEAKLVDYDLKHDDDDETVADEFLDMLGDGREEQVEEDKEKEEEEEEEDEVESPRALLLKQFEEESMLGGFDLDGELDRVQSPPPPKLQEHELDKGGGALLPRTEKIVIPDEWSYSDDSDKELSSIMDAAESELEKATQALRSKARAKMLEDAEAEALLQEWGLDENTFQRDGSPPLLPAAAAIDTTSLVVRSKLAEELPPLAHGIGSSVPTADGGSLRSMDPSLFQSAAGKQTDGKLVMHVSKPVVVPAEMGSSAIDVLRNFAASGSEGMAAQAMEAMPLEDITGKSVAQIALEGQACFEENNRRYDTALLEANRYALEDGSGSAGALTVPASSSSLAVHQPRAKKKQELANRGRSSGEFVSLDELAPVAMEKIEELAIQGLKIQCDMADEEAPYSIEASPAAAVPLIKGSSSSTPLLLEAPSSNGMISMALSLDEWMRLDSGLDDDEEANEKKKAVMAAHRAAHTTTDLVLNLSSGDSGGGGVESSTTGNSGGKMGKTLTLAMLVQLRDPLRNFEPVGAPMMALVEAERVLVPPRPKLWKRVAIKGNSEQPNEDEEKEELEMEPQFKVIGVHVAGLSSAVDEGSSLLASKISSKKPQQDWGNQRLQQSGSRWLIANGMGKSSGAKHPLLRSSKGAARGKTDPSPSLWSISSSSSSSSARNPDVKFAKNTFGGKKRF